MAVFELHYRFINIVTMYNVNMVRGIYFLRRGCSIAETFIAPGESFYTVYFISRSTFKLRGNWLGITKIKKGKRVVTGRVMEVTTLLIFSSNLFTCILLFYLQKRKVI